MIFVTIVGPLGTIVDLTHADKIALSATKAALDELALAGGITIALRMSHYDARTRTVDAAWRWENPDAATLLAALLTRRAS